MTKTAKIHRPLMPREEREKLLRAPVSFFQRTTYGGATSCGTTVNEDQQGPLDSLRLRARHIHAEEEE